MNRQNAPAAFQRSISTQSPVTGASFLPIRLLPIMSLLLLLVSATACTGIKRDTLPPEVSLSKVTLLSAGLFEQRWQLTLRTYNPNSYPLSMRGLKYQLFVAGNEMARGLSNDKVTLPANGEALVSTEVTTSLMQIMSQMQALQRAREKDGKRESGGENNLVEYRIDGSVVLGSMPLPLSFSHEGTTTLPSLR